MDAADEGAQRAEFFLGLDLARHRQAPKPLPTGACMNCGSPVPHPMLFCDVDCEIDYDKRVSIYRKTHA